MMANSRMYLRHKSTGNKILLTKAVNDGFYIYHEINDLNDFFDKCRSDITDNGHYGDKFMFGSIPSLEDEDPDKCPFELYME